MMHEHELGAQVRKTDDSSFGSAFALTTIIVLLALMAFCPRPAHAQVVINPAPVPVCTEGQILKLLSSVWTCAADSGGGITGAQYRVPYLTATDTTGTSAKFVFDGDRFLLGETSVERYLMHVMGADGAELVTTGGWTVGAGWTESPDETFTHTPGSTATIANATTIVAGRVYRVQMTVSGGTTGDLETTLGGCGAPGACAPTHHGGDPGSSTFYIEATDTTGLALHPTTDFDGVVSAVSVIEVTGIARLGNDVKANAFVIGYDGRIGIGTDEPDTELTLVGDVEAVLKIMGIGGAVPVLELRNDDEDVRFLFSVDAVGFTLNSDYGDVFAINHEGRPAFYAYGTTQEALFQTDTTGLPVGIVMWNDADSFGYEFNAKITGFAIRNTATDIDLLEIEPGGAASFTATGGGNPMQLRLRAATTGEQAELYLYNTADSGGVGFSSGSTQLLDIWDIFAEASVLRFLPTTYEWVVCEDTGTTGQVLTANSGACPSWENAAGGGSGTVTSVAMTVPTGLSIAGSPVTTTGTLAVSLTSGYMIPGGGSAGQWLASNGASAPSFTAAGALTKTDDTNVTLTLGGTPATALLQAASLTLGWTGQLGLTRGGTGANLTAVNGGPVYSAAGALAIGSAGTDGQPLTSTGAGAPSYSSVLMMTSTSTSAVKKAPIFIQNNAATTTAGQNIGTWVQLADTAAADPTSACNTANPTAGDFVGSYICMETTATRNAATIGASAGLFGGNWVLTAQNGENITMVGLEIDIQNLMGTGSTVPAAFAAESTVGVGVVMANTSTPGDGSAGFATHINGGTSNQWKYGFEAAGVRNSSFYARRSTNAGNVDPVNVLYNDTQADNFLYTVETGTHDYILRSTQGLAAAGVDIHGAGGDSAGRITVAGVAPSYVLYEIGATSNEKQWRLNADGDVLKLQTMLDDYSAAGDILTFPRTANTPDAWYSAVSAGFGTGATVSARVHAISTGDVCRFGYDASNYWNCAVSSTGVVTFNAVGSGSAFTFSDPVTLSTPLAGASGGTGYASVKLAGITHTLSTSYICGSSCSQGGDGSNAIVKSITVPANTLTQVGDRIRIRVHWAPTTGTAIVGRLAFNGTTVGTGVTVGTATSGTGTAEMQTWVTLEYIDSTHANIWSYGTTGVFDATTSVPNSASMAWTADQLISLEQSNIANNNIIVYSLTVEVWPKGVVAG